MKYQFENPPTREGLIEEFGIHPDRLHRIETFIRSVAANEDDFEWFKDKFTMEESAYYLKRNNLIESFAMLCALPARPPESLVILTDPQFFGALHVKARFDQSGALTSWPETSRLDLCSFQVSQTDGRTPNDYVEDEEWMVTSYQRAADCSMNSVFLKDTTDCLAVSCYPLSAVQWRRKFLAERWFHPDLKPSERLVDAHDLAEWTAFVARLGNPCNWLNRFEEWATGRESWEGFDSL